MSPSAVAQYFSKSYAIVIGIDHVPNSRWHKLDYAEGDARAVANLLVSQGYDVTPLYGPEATKTNIGTKVLRLARTLGADDRVIFYFAGHGHSEKLGNKLFGYLVPYDGRDNSAAYISMDEITTFSEQMGAAKHQLFLIDACFSGLLIARSGGVDPSIPNYISEVAKRPARQVIAAGGIDQEVLDSGPDGHSVFAHALLEGLSLGFADRREDGYILVSDLMSYLVERASNKYQTPVTGNLPGHGLGEFMFTSPKPAIKRLLPTEAAKGGLRRGDAFPPTPEPAPNSKQPKSKALSKAPVADYTPAEYNAEQACAAEKVPATQVKCLDDDFVPKYPNSALLIYVYPLYVNAYNQLKNPDKVIEYADKTVALGDKVDAGTRYGVLYARALAYTTLKPDAQASGAVKAREAAKAGLTALDEVKKPDNVTDEDFKTQKLQHTIFFHFTCATAAMAAKDYPGAVECYKAVLALNPDDLSTNYYLGKAYMAITPPQQRDAFWYFAKAVVSKSATEKQADQVKKYLKGQISYYQGGNVCDSLINGEMNELLQLAASLPDRPSSYSLPSAADITAALKDMTIASFVTDVKGGGDKANLTWTAACGLEFPDVLVKVIEVVPGDPLVLKIAFVTSEAEFEAATTPNMDVKVVGQPEASRVKKDSAVHFTGTLVAYDPDPFFVHWDKAKVKEEDIPKEKAAPKKPVGRRN